MEPESRRYTFPSIIVTGSLYDIVTLFGLIVLSRSLVVTAPTVLDNSHQLLEGPLIIPILKSINVPLFILENHPVLVIQIDIGPDS